MRSSRRRFPRAAVAVLVMAGALVLGLGAQPAAAHAVLQRTTPADGSTVPTVPASVALIFDEAPRAEFSAIHITGPDGQRRDFGPVQIAKGVVTEELNGPRPAGRYVVDWRVVSDDGHPVSGEFAFTARSAAPELLVNTARTGPGPGNPNSGAIILSAAAAVVVVGAVLGLYARRKRRPVVHE